MASSTGPRAPALERDERPGYRLAGVMGWPVERSLSPVLHGLWLRRHGLEGAYVKLAVAPGRAEAALRALPDLGFRGCNVTVPHKEAAFAAVDEADPWARAAKAVNTVLVLPDGRLRGLNTDGRGFLAHLRAAAAVPAGDESRPSPQPPPEAPQTAPGARNAPAGPVGASAPLFAPDGRLNGRCALLGAGGAARGVALALVARPPGGAGVRELALVNRDRARAEALAADLLAVDLAAFALPGASPSPAPEIRIEAWPPAPAALEGVRLLVNSTSLGMAGKPPLPVGAGHLAAMAPGAAVYDLVYAPLETALLRDARAAGLHAIDGLGMLLHQAVPGFAWWGGVTPAVDDALRGAVLRAS